MIKKNFANILFLPRGRDRLGSDISPTKAHIRTFVTFLAPLIADTEWYVKTKEFVNPRWRSDMSDRQASCLGSDEIGREAAVAAPNA